MVFDFSDLTEEQKQRLEKEVNEVLLDLYDEEWVNLYNCIFSDNTKFPYIYRNDDFTVNEVLKRKNILSILANLEKGKERYYSVDDDWFILKKATLYSNDNPHSLLWGDLKEATEGMAKLLVENYADDFNIQELWDVMIRYTAEGDEEEE